MTSNYQNKLHSLDTLLTKYRWLWQPQAFKCIEPSWCQQQPSLTHALLALSPAQVSALVDKPSAALDLLSDYLPELKQLSPLCQLPLHTTQPQATQLPAYLSRDIPGRKWQQIQAFAHALTLDNKPILEWCGGKGHLGRLLAFQHSRPVHTLELQTHLCNHGQQLSHKAHVQQRFSQIDVLSVEAALHLTEHTAVALHACGELHRKLLRDCLQQQCTDLNFSPCCYHLGLTRENYQPFNNQLLLRPNNEDLRIAVTETVTANADDIRQRDQEMHWKLAYDQLRRDIRNDGTYQPIMSIEKSWLKLSFTDFCKTLAQREQLSLPTHWNTEHYLELGLQRKNNFLRLSIPRQAFRRAIEMWLVLDMSVALEAQGYHVKLSQFCPSHLTPRNILIQAHKTEPL